MSMTGELSLERFVDIDGEAEPFEDFVRPVHPRIPHPDLSLLRFSGLSTRGPIDGNWKLVIETGCEDCHLPWTHPQLGPRGGTFSGERGGETWVAIASPRKAEAADPPIPPLLAQFRDKVADNGLSNEMVIVFIVPHAIMAVLDDHVLTSICCLVAHGRTLSRRAFHFIGGVATDEARRPVRDSWEAAGDQDMPFVREVQGRHAQRAELGIETRVSDHWESKVHHIRNPVANRLAV